MFDYLQQFNNLPKELRDKVSSPSAMAALAELEKKYQVDLAMAVMKVMIKSLTLKSLPAYFESDSGLSQSAAENLTKDLSEKIFLNVAAYLGLEKEARAIDLDKDINLIIKEAGLILPSSDLISRLKGVLSTYLRGIRSRVMARDALAKPINMGGLNLSPVEIDRVFKVCEQKTFKSLEVNLAATSKPVAPQSRLDKIIASADGANAEYNLKQALASGQIKKAEVVSFKEVVPFKLDTSHEIEAPAKELDLPLPEKVKIIESVKIAPAPIKPAAPAPKLNKEIKPAEPRIAEPTKIAPAQAIKQVEVPKPAAPIIRKPVAEARPAVAPSVSKKVMHDIKPMPKIMGPIEELQFLDLVNFRRLGKTPAETTAKIFSKIKLLETDGYDKMVAGVRAWRQSPVNRLYLKMAQEALSKGLTIKEFVLAAEKENKEYLKIEEIEAVLTLNSKLVF